MYQFDVRARRKQKVQNQSMQPDFLLLGSEPLAGETAVRHTSLLYGNRYLAKRRVMRTIRRLRHQQ